MTLEPFRGVRFGRVVTPRADEGPDQLRENPGEPSRRVRITAQFRVASVHLAASSTERFDHQASLELEEEPVGISGKPEIRTPAFFLNLPLQGKEVALLSGMVGRSVPISGTIPERAWSYNQLEEAYQDLKGRYENLLFILSEVSHQLGPHLQDP